MDVKAIEFKFNQLKDEWLEHSSNILIRNDNFILAKLAEILVAIDEIKGKLNNE